MRSRTLFNTSLITGCFFAFFLVGCYFDKEDELYGNAECDLTAVSFSSHISPIVANSCAVSGCHVQGGSSGLILENYTQLKAKVDDGSFENRVLISQDMPPGTPLTECQIELIRTWLQAGAPNN